VLIGSTDSGLFTEKEQKDCDDRNLFLPTSQLVVGLILYFVSPVGIFLGLPVWRRQLADPVSRLDCFGTSL